MAGSKRNNEGYLLIDQRDSPGVSPIMAHRVGLPVGANKGVFEAPTYTCSHCQKVVVLNPLRNRDRAWCRHCDQYLCDPCGGVLAATGNCNLYREMLDNLQEEGLKLIDVNED
jgi:hypothetical protein